MEQIIKRRCFFKKVPAEPLESTLSTAFFFFFGGLSRAGGGVGRDLEAAVCM